MKKEIPWWRKPLFDPRTSKSEEEHSLRRRIQMLMLVPLLLQLPYWYQVIVGDRSFMSWWDDLLDLDPVACMFFASMVAFPVELIIVNKMERNEEEIRNKDIEKYAQEKEKEKGEQLSRKAQKRETALDYNSAITIWEEIGKPEEAARVRKLKAEQGAVKVDQTVVHGDYIDDRDTIVKDSVINRSNVGAGGDDKVAKLEKIANLKREGLIDDNDYEKMKREIIG